MSIEDANIRHFRDKADWYDNNPRHKKAQEAVSRAFEFYNQWIGVDWITPEERTACTRDVRLLDYACGTGIVTRRLGPYVTHAFGIDITPSMVDSFNAQVKASGLPLSHVSAITGNLLKDPIEPPELMEPKYFNFDLAVIGLGFHHFANPAEAAIRLSNRLKPGGVLLLIDLIGHSHDAEEHQTNQSITTHGFNEAEMRKIYDGAGLTDFGFKVMDEPMVMDGKDGGTVTRTIFFARGVKPFN